MLEYLCLLQDWYWLSPETSMHIAHVYRHFVLTGSVVSTFPWPSREYYWMGQSVVGAGGSFSVTPNPCMVYHDWWLWTTTPPPSPESPWWLIYFKQKGVHKRVCVCVCWGDTVPEALMHVCTGEMHRDVSKILFSNVHGTYQCTKINLKLFLSIYIKYIFF